MSDIDLTKLQPASDGRQRDPDVPGGVAEFEPAGVVAVPLVRRRGHPEEGTYALSQVELAGGRLSAHPAYLILRRAPDGETWIATDREDLEQEAMERAAAWAQGQIDRALGELRGRLDQLGEQARSEVEAAALRLLLGL